MDILLNMNSSSLICLTETAFKSNTTEKTAREYFYSWTMKNLPTEVFLVGGNVVNYQDCLLCPASFCIGLHLLPILPGCLVIQHLLQNYCRQDCWCLNAGQKR